jgi:ketosteroid isomerase-like protein
MSQENIEIVRRTTEAYNRGDFDEAIAWMDPAIEWDMTRVDVPDPEVYRGFEGLMTFDSLWNESWEWLELEPKDFIEAGERVVSLVRQIGRGKLSGAQVEQRFAQLWTLRDGKIVRMEMHPDKESALEAAGLSE